MLYVNYKYDCIMTVFLRQANEVTYFVRQCESITQGTVIDMFKYYYITILLEYPNLYVLDNASIVMVVTRIWANWYVLQTRSIEKASSSRVLLF